MRGDEDVKRRDDKLRLANRRRFLLPFCLLLFSFPIIGQDLAPDGPGKDAQWATAGKQGVGTANSPNSKVWFTLAQGVMTEVYYPDVTTANVHLLQFIVVNPKTKTVETEQDDATSIVKPRSMSWSKNVSPISNISLSKYYYS